MRRDPRLVHFFLEPNPDEDFENAEILSRKSILEALLLTECKLFSASMSVFFCEQCILSKKGKKGPTSAITLSIPAGK